MSLADRQQRAYDARNVSFLEGLGEGKSAIQSAIDAIKNIRIPFNKTGTLGDIFGGIVDAAGSYFGVNTTSFTQATLKSEPNVSTAGVGPFGGNSVVAPFAALFSGKPTTPSTAVDAPRMAPLFLGDTTETITASPASVAAPAQAPGLGSFFESLTPSVPEPLSLGPWFAIFTALGLLATVLVLRRRG